jgi:hypothetical protein
VTTSRGQGSSKTTDLPCNCQKRERNEHTSVERAVYPIDLVDCLERLFLRSSPPKVTSTFKLDVVTFYGIEGSDNAPNTSLYKPTVLFKLLVTLLTSSVHLPPFIHPSSLTPAPVKEFSEPKMSAICHEKLGHAEKLHIPVFQTPLREPRPDTAAPDYLRSLPSCIPAQPVAGESDIPLPRTLVLCFDGTGDEFDADVRFLKSSVLQY